MQARTVTTGTSGFLPGTTSYVYVRCRTYTLRHRTSDVRCRVQYRTYDIVRTILHTILHVRHRTFDHIVGPTYDIVRLTYDVVGSGKSMSYTMSYVSKTYDVVRLKMYIVYDVVGAYRIRCRMFSRKRTTSYVTYDVVYFYYIAKNLRYRRCTYDVVCMTYDIVRLIMRSVPAAETPRPPPAGVCQHGRSFPRDFRLFLRLSVSRAA